MAVPLRIPVRGVHAHRSKAGNFLNKCLRFSGLGLRGSIVVVAIIAALPAFAALVWAAQDAYHIRRASALEQVHVHAHSLASRIQDTIDATKRSLNALGKLPVVELTQTPQCRDILNAYKQRLVWTTGAWVTTADGIVTCDLAGSRPIDRSERRDFINAVHTKNFAIGEHTIESATHRPVIPVSLPVYDQTGALRLVLGTTISVEYINSIFAQHNFPDGSAIDLVARDGTLLLHWTTNEQGGAISQSLDARDAASFALAFSGDSSVETTGANGTHYFMGSSRLKNGEIALVARHPAAVLLQPAEKAAMIFALATIATLLATMLIVAWVTSHTVLDPIHKLTVAVAGMSDGEPGTRLDDQAFVGDLATLVRTFNEMADQIKAREKSRLSAEDRLKDAIDSIPIAFSIWDKDDRLVRVNREIIGAERPGDPAFVPGRAFAETSELLKSRYYSKSDQQAEYIAKRKKQHETASGRPMEILDEHGHWYEFRERRMIDGGTVSTRIDITSRKLDGRESELERYVLRLISQDRTLHQVMSDLCTTYEREFPGVRCMLFCQEGKNQFHYMAPSLPAIPAFVVGDVEHALKAGYCEKSEIDLDPSAFYENLSMSAKNYFARLDLHSFLAWPLLNYVSRPVGLIVLCGPEGTVLTLPHQQLAKRAAKLAESAIMRTIGLAALRNSEIHLKTIMENTAAGLLTFDQNLNVTSFNGPASNIFGIARQEIIGANFFSLMQKMDADRISAVISEHLRTGLPVGGIRYEIEGVRSDGITVPISLYVAEIPVSRDREFLATIHDLTDTKKAEDRLRRGQKMEAVGQLTGGVAHEFNNLLAVILSDLETLNDDGLADDEYEMCLKSALAATRKGADLIHRLLTFSKRQTLRPGSVMVNDLVGGLLELLRRSFDKNIKLEFRPGTDVGQVYIDAGQLESALANLAVNARDAMANGGRLTISTSIVDWDPKYDRSLSDLPAGFYVQISVSDTGVGMPPDVVARAIEPFFTTKEFGRGSGLGLSIAYGFASQSGGTVDIRSAVGHGTTVSILLPKDPSIQAAIPFRTLSDIEMHA